MSAGTAASPQPVIRPLRPADQTDWMRLWNAYQRFYEVDIPAETTALTWQRLLDPTEPVHGAVAVLQFAVLDKRIHYR